ncbi:MAG: alpha-amylase family glycosyl hydrolase [Actinomycetota bacterium]
MTHPGTAPWWQDGVVYQVYPRSFADGDGDGSGDLAGIRARLDHLSWLGVDAVWLSPVYRSPMADMGYDVADHCAVDPAFGTLRDLDGLIGDAHVRGLRVLLDWVPNHTSDRHPWFLESRASRGSRRRGWYVWRDGRDGKPPNNWRSAFGGPAWTWDAATRQWYLHLFLPQQPDLNWGNPEVAAAMHDTLRFWLARGVDGFRVDAVHCVGKDPRLADQPASLGDAAWAGLNDDPRTHEILRGVRRVVDAWPGERVVVGEVTLRGTSRIAAYYGRGDELHLVFNFLSLDAAWDAGAWRELIDGVDREVGRARAWPTWVLSNHDVVRFASRVGGGERRVRAAAVLLLTLRGTPFVYQGEELGLQDASVPAARRVDPGGRDGCRAPIPWDPGPGHGWGEPPWLPFPPDAARRSVSAQREDRGSVLWLYRRLLAARRSSPALRRGLVRLLDAPPGVLAYLRTWGGDRRVVVVSFTGAPARVALPGRWRVEVSARGDGGDAFTGEVPPEGAFLLAPAAGA